MSQTSQIHKSVFGNYGGRENVDLAFSEENPTTKWEFGDEIGRGAFAIIKKCYQKKDKTKLYAAKFVKYDDEALKILKREVAMIQKWEHEKFIYHFEVYIVRKYVVLIMEWVDAANLLPYLINRQEQAEKNKRKPKLSEKDIALLIKQLLEALKYLHDQSVAYLDIKPDNIMVKENGSIKLVDYDNCRHIVSKQGDVVDCIGTPELTAPEALVFENCSAATDMWAVGALMYLMMTGTSAFAAPTEDEVRHKVAKVQYEIKDELFGPASQHCKDIIMGVFKRIPEKRTTLAEVMNGHWFQFSFKLPIHTSIVRGFGFGFYYNPEFGKKWLNFLKDVLWNLGRNTLKPTADDYKKLKETMDELESEEPVFASCVLRSFKEEEYESPEEEDDEEDE